MLTTSRLAPHRRVLATCLAAACLVAAGSASAAKDDADASALTPRQQVLVDEMEAIRVAQSRSADLRVRIVASLSAAIGAMFGPDADALRARLSTTAAALYEQARGSTDPVALEALLYGCSFLATRADRCDPLALARRWVEADTQNQAAWLALASQLRARGFATEARTTFERASLASRWHEQYGDLARSLADALPTGLSPQARNLALGSALSLSAVFASSLETVQLIANTCRDADAPRAACARIMDTMMRDGGTLQAIGVIPSLAARSRLPAETVGSYRREVDALQWALRHSPLVGERWALDEDDDARAAASATRLRTIIDTSERRFLERILVDAHVAKDDAARRYVATLTRDQLAHRAELARVR